MPTRRRFLKLAALTGLSLTPVWRACSLPAVSEMRRRAERLVRSSPARLSATEIPKYERPLVIPPVMPPAHQGPNHDEYEIAARQITQQILPPSMGLPPTAVWAYGAARTPEQGEVDATFNSPAYTIEGRSGRTIRVKWINGLVDGEGHYLPHLLPMDPTLHWANPASPRDAHRTFERTPAATTAGPVPLVTHVHGAHVPAISDGYPEAWYLPDAANIPEGYYQQGSHYDSVKPAEAGAAWFEYPNDQRAATLWYHDHALGITRLNVYAGLAGFWILRDEIEEGLNLPGPAPSLGDPSGIDYYEIPILIQDRAFHDDGSLYYPDRRALYDGYEGPFMPESQVPPVWNPQVFGDVMVVNGRTWPYLEVEPRQYRLRFLNGCNSRVLILKTEPAVTLHQIGSEGGLLPDHPVPLEEIPLAPAERADVIVDFSAFRPGDEILLRNVGPDVPLTDGDFKAADPATTGQVMQFRVIPARGADTSTPVAEMALPPIKPLGEATRTRAVSLHDHMDEQTYTLAAALLGADGAAKLWSDPITENPGLGDIEVWAIENLTMEAHPIHLHLVMFQVIERADYAGNVYEPEPWETGWKDTVIVYPGQITRIKARFDRPGLYVWHCHILEHEDNEMMRPYHVGPLP